MFDSAPFLRFVRRPRVLAAMKANLPAILLKTRTVSGLTQTILTVQENDNPRIVTRES